MLADEPVDASTSKALTPTGQKMLPLDLPPAEEWALVEIFGHRSHMGRIREVERAGAKLLRIEVPTDDHGVFEVFDYGGGAIFSVRPMTEEAVRKACARHRELYGRPEPTIDQGEEDPFGDEEGPF
jgi:hypothetical protein